MRDLLACAITTLLLIGLYTVWVLREPKEKTMKQKKKWITMAGVWILALVAMAMAFWAGVILAVTKIFR